MSSQAGAPAEIRENHMRIDVLIGSTALVLAGSVLAGCRSQGTS